MNDSKYMTNFPVYSHLGKELLPSGTALDGKALSDLNALPLDRRAYPIGFTLLVKNDLEAVLENPVYENIFRDKESRDLVFSMLKRVVIPHCGIEVIEYFRKNDIYTYMHMLAVFAISTHLVSLLASAGDFSEVGVSSITHDIGKCSVPLNLLQKEQPLSIAERKHLEHHTIAGYTLLHYYTDTRTHPMAAFVARDHHEYTDGSGYPAGLQAINLFTEIVIISDIYDALLSPRPYRMNPFNNRTALEELTAKAQDGKISKQIVQALVASNRKGKVHWSECMISDQIRGTQPENNNYGIHQEIKID